MPSQLGRPPAREVPRGARRGASGSRTRAGEPVADAAGRQGVHVLEMQRRRLLSALVELAAEQGLEGASIGRICKRAGVSRRTFYELFEDREACLLAALAEALERVAAPVLGAHREDRPWRERIRAALAALLERFDAEPGVARLCVLETLRAGPLVLERRRQAIEILTAAVEEGRAESKQVEELPPLTAQGVVGGALSVIHARLLERDGAPLADLAGPLAAMIVHPYLGVAAARRELRRVPSAGSAAPSKQRGSRTGVSDPFKGLPIRFTYRTARVLATIATEPGTSNRAIADASGVADEGQMSRLLRRLEHSGLIENRSDGHFKGEPNAWTLTGRGEAVHAALGVQPAS